ncbi:MAG: penicillin binding protein PBP4B [Kangiellaceae bacterium]|nr:penicillin binding protein PBP4B [Kangiellaceae bacterium]
MQKFISKFNKALLVASSLLISSCTGVSVKQLPSNNHNDRIRYLIIHYTAIDYQESVEALTKKDGVSAHYLIPERGDPSYVGGDTIPFQLVDEKDRAWHAGVSYWQGKNGLNDQSIGIELVYQAPCTVEEIPAIDIQAEPTAMQKISKGFPSGLNLEATSDRICIYPEFDNRQISQLIKLVKQIILRNPEISPERITGHADITPGRRVDPGPKFPWYRLYKEGIGAWYENDTVSKYWQQFHRNLPGIGLVQAALRSYGYGVIETGILDAQTINALTVFQMHFRPWRVDGHPSSEVVATLFALIERYRGDRIAKLLKRFELENITQIETESFSFLGQFDGRFPQLKQSSRQLVNNRKLFRGYKNRGELHITNNGVKSIDVFINGKMINVKKKLAKTSPQTIDISKYTKNGYNTLKIKNIEPKNASLVIDIPFPQLINGPATKAGFSESKLKKIDQLINSEIKQGFPGATLLIAKQGKIIKHTAYGYSKRYDKNGKKLSIPTKMEKETLFDMASNTKMYAANFAVMKLVSENKLDVNLPIYHYLTEYQGDGRESRLVKDLLTHSAGYQPVVNFHDRNNDLGESFYSQNKNYTQRLLIEKVPFVRGRNIKTIYSDVDYMLLGTLIERVTGMALDQYVEQQIYQPLGLSKTLFNPLTKEIDKRQIAATELRGNSRQSTLEFDNMRSDVIQGEVHDEKAFHSMQGVSGHAGLFSTAKETAILASVILNRGGYGDVRLFDKSQMDQFLKPSSLNVTLGLGWRRAGNGERAWQFGPYASPYAIGHTGWTGTVTIIDPFYDLIIVLLTNKKHTRKQKHTSFFSSSDGNYF